MIFHPRQKKANVNVPLSLENTVIKQVTETKFLGVLIDQRLSWKPHIDLQKRLVRLITKAHYLANTAPLFSQLKVLDIFSINSFSVATFMYSYHHNLLPSNFHDLFLRSNQVHQYETRLASQYRPHFCRTNINQFSILYRGP